jgi:hypothetical protein
VTTRKTSPVKRVRKSSVTRQAKARAAEITAEFQARRDVATAGSVACPADTPHGEIPVEPKFREVGTRNADIDEETFARLERLYGSKIREEERRLQRENFTAKWRAWEGTPETQARIAAVPRHRRQWPLDRMLAQGKISREEHGAGEEIARVIEAIEGSVALRSASLEARVDCSNSSRDALVEALGRVRAEVTFRVWRQALPKPPRMILDMITTNQSYVAIARKYNFNWRTARKRLISALRAWDDCKLAVRMRVDRDDVAELYARLGDGVLLPPRPKLAQVVED